MPHDTTGPGTGGIFFSIGYGIGSLEKFISGKANPMTPARESARAGTAAARSATASTPGAPAMPAVPSEVGTLAFIGLGWALRWLLRPGPINWPRAVLAGVAGTACSDLARILQYQQAGDQGLPDPAPWEDEPADIVARYVSGIARAVAYAAIIHPRLPGPALARGICFGAVDAAAAESGGLMQVLEEIAPGLPIPLASLHTPLHSQGPLPHLAFGFGVGLLYGDGKKKRRRREPE